MTNAPTIEPLADSIPKGLPTPDREPHSLPPHNTGCLWILVLILFLWFAIHQAMTGDFA